MKLKAPEGTSSISVGGENIDIAADGTCEVSGALAHELCDSFGFTVFGANKTAQAAPVIDKFTDMSRAEIIGYIKGKGLPVVPSTDTDTLRAQARTQYSPAERAADEAVKNDASKG